MKRLILGWGLMIWWSFFYIWDIVGSKKIILLNRSVTHLDKISVYVKKKRKKKKVNVLTSRPVLSELPLSVGEAVVAGTEKGEVEDGQFSKYYLKAVCECNQSVIWGACG